MDSYFATVSPDDLGSELNTKISQYYDFVNRFQILDRWRRSYQTYFGLSNSGADTSRISQAGSEGENYILKVNHFRSILQNLKVLICQNPPALQPKSTNTDAKSMNQTILARSVLDYYFSECKLEEKLQKAVEFALYGAEGFVHMPWNPTQGRVYAVDPQTGRPIYDGDIDVSVFHPIDIIREVNTTKSGAEQDWYLIREWVNKWDLAAKYPELADDIQSLHTSPDFWSQYHYLAFEFADPDQIPLYTFYHRASESLPNGRQFQFLTPDVWLNDGPLAYKSIPLHRIAPSEWDGCPFGYTVAYDLIGLQNAFDALMSMVTTNQMNYGQQNIVATRGAELSVGKIGQGLNLIEINPGATPPAPLNLLQSAPELFQQMNALVQNMEMISGINSTARGNPEASLKSGTALALVSAQALQFNSGLQSSYQNLLSSVGTALIQILQTYALTPRIAAIAGYSNRSRIKEFKGADLDNISRVTCEAVNPLSKTASGRLDMARDMLQIPGLIKSPQHYLEVVETGRLSPLIEHETSQLLLIRSENEELLDGHSVQALATDMHIDHIQEHRTVLDSPEARANPALVQVTLAHIQQHIELLKTVDPQFLIVLGQTPLQPANLPQNPPGAPAKPLGQTNPAVPGEMLNPTSPLTQAAQEAQAKPPELPNVPAGTPPQLAGAYDQLKSQMQSKL